MRNAQYILAILCLSSFGRNPIVAQGDFYAIDHIPEIRIYFEQSNWDELLDSMYAEGDYGRLGADVTIDGSLYHKVGVRYKGFSSYGSDRLKNPLNIDLDYIFSDQNHQGYKKVKLSNVIQDPSFLREVLTYEIAQKYMPSSRANYANVYINDVLIGLYTNVEAVEIEFLEDHFNSNDGTLVKCNPTQVDLNGENSNLNQISGADESDYYSLYNMRSSGEDDWANLLSLIDILNNDPSNIEQILNVDRTLWMHALNYAVINFDSYIGYAQNYYLYQDVDGKFNPILWDLNMSFASYRFTDASDYWDGFSIAEAKTIDPLQHLNGFSVFPRPLIRNILENETYKRMYLAHIRTILEENFNNGWYQGRADTIQSIIDLSVQLDTNKFYSYQDFIDNKDSTVSDLIDYPGIIDLMEDRASYLNSYPGISGHPEINAVNHFPNSTIIGDDLWINAEITGMPTQVLLAYRKSSMDVFEWIQMVDDGNNNDGIAGDGLYGAKISSISNVVDYYVYAENDSAGCFSPSRAAYEYYTVKSRLRPGDLVINELMTNNGSVYFDQADEYDPWIELYNNTSYVISTTDMMLSDNASNFWSLPNTIIQPNSFMIFWADGDTTQGSNHMSFELNEMGGHLALTYSDGDILDSTSFGKQESVASWGRLPNGTGDFEYTRPSFKVTNYNSESRVLQDLIFAYPNPANDRIYLRMNYNMSYKLALYSSDGRRINYTESNGMNTIDLDTEQWAPGIYLLHVQADNQNELLKLIITH